MIVREPRHKRFTLIGNELLDDPRLGAKALGMLVYILSKPDNWKAQTSHLSARFHCGREAVLGALREIESAGYLTRRKFRNAQGLFEWEHIISDKSGLSMVGFSVDGSTVDGLSVDGLSVDGKPDSITNTDSTKTELTKTELTKESARGKTDFERFLTAYNENRPQGWAKMQLLTKPRQKLLERLIGDCGGADNALAALVNALNYAKGDEWYSTKTLSFENFASNGKILQLHERYIQRLEEGLPGGENLVDYIRARRPEHA
jgi:hypothetical protein